MAFTALTPLATTCRLILATCPLTVALMALPALPAFPSFHIFTWDMLENGILLPVLNYQGEAGTHSEFVEGLMAYDMKKTADDLAFFGYDAV